MTTRSLGGAHRDLATVLKSLTARATSKQLQLAFDIEPDVPDFVTADTFRMQQVITNLVGNAIKFTASGGYIGLKVRGITSDDTGNHVLEFCVEDTGEPCEPPM